MELTKSNDVTCSLFEEILDEFFEEYNLLYGAIQDADFTEHVNLRCLNNKESKLEIELITKDGVITELFISSIKEYMAKKFKVTCIVTQTSENIINIIFIKKVK